MHCGQGAAFVPAFSCLGAFSFLEAPPAFADNRPYHLRPQYRTASPLQGILAKVQAGYDAFVSEKYQDQIAEILRQWRTELLSWPGETKSVERALADNFSGSPLRVAEARRVRADSILEIHANSFPAEATGRLDFVRQLRTYLSAFSKLFTIDFQIIQIVAEPEASTGAGTRVATTLRYELVGTGAGFHREERVGAWQLRWQADAAGNFRITEWKADGETQSRTLAPAFADISRQALGGNPSYAAQLALGVDYWRSVLDGASGIDIYGHNGVSFGDIDNDGFDDLYVCQPGGLPNRLYRNRGDGSFEDITESAGVGVLENTACALFADIDNDGRQDLIVVRAGQGPLLFSNEGGGNFRVKPGAFRFATPPQGTFTGAAMADYDRDGWLDIYFSLYTYYQGTGQYNYPLPYHDAENGPPNFLMRNNRNGTFTDVTAESGLNQNNTRYSFCCGWNDFDGDGWPDLYVVNDFGRKNLYRNNGNGTFSDIAAAAGVEDIGAGMSVSWLDYNSDGLEDLYVGDMWTAAGMRVSNQEEFQKSAPAAVRKQYRKHAMGNSLFRNHGASKFQDHTNEAGVGIGRWAWSSDAWDFDHDGFPDLYVVNGMVSGPPSDQPDLNSFFWRQVVANSPLDRKPSHVYEQAWTAINELIRSDVSWSGFERNLLYVNHRDGTFSDVSGPLELDFIEDGRSFALADVDHDGRLELVLKNRNGPQVRMLKNVIKDLSPSISFCLRGTKSNRDAIGAVITVETAGRRQTRTLQAGSGFLAQHSKELHFGLGNTEDTVRASIRWPSGKEQHFDGLPLNQRIFVVEDVESVRTEPYRKAVPVVAGGRLHIEPPGVLQTWLLVPVPAPQLSLPDLTGKSLSISQLRGKTALLYFWSTQTENWEQDLQALGGLAGQGTRSSVLAVNVDGKNAVEKIRGTSFKNAPDFSIVQAPQDMAAVYNILYRQLFDRHRDLELPCAFLLDAEGNIVKVYHGGRGLNLEQVRMDFGKIPVTPEERIAKGLPFPGIRTDLELHRNYLSYGSVYYQRGYYDQAAAFFQRVLDDNPSSAEALYGLGSVYLQQQKNVEAGRAFERVTRLEASYPGTLPDAWNNLGLVAAREGRMKDAASCFQRALSLSPDHPVALLNLGNAYRQMKNWEDARATLERAVALNPDDADSNYGLAMVYAQLNESDKAYEYLQTALRLRSDYPEALNNLGILYLRTGRRDQAVATFEQCIRAAPAFDQAYLNLARVYALEGNPEKARAVLQQLLVEHPGHEQAEKALAELPGAH